MSIGHFPADYGQGTGLAAGHANLGSELNRMISGGHPDVPLARRLVNKILYVDPMNGDDHPENDGTKTPLKSLDALSIRMPQDTKDSTEAAYFGRSVIKLLPGDYNMERDLFLRIPPNAKLEGTYEEIGSFVLESIDANNIDLYKDSGTLAWTPGQFREMFIFVSFYGFVDILIPILDSGDHWVRVAWDWNWISGTAPSPTDTIAICDLKSIIHGNNKVLSIDVGNNSIIGEVDIDGCSYIQSFGPFASFNHCRFSNGMYGLLNLQGYKVYSQCIFRDMSQAGIQVAHQGSNAFRGSVFVRCSDAISVDWGAIVSFFFEVCFFKDCPEAIKSGSFSGIRIQYDLDDLYCENVTSWIRSDKGAEIVLLSALTSAIDGKAPTNLITAKNGCQVSLHAGSTLEAVTNSLNINGTISTLANFFAGGGHNGWIEDTNGNHVFART